MKIYDKSYGAVSFRRELVNGIFLQTKVEYARRSPLVNQSDYSFRDQDGRPYQSNDPRDPLNFGPSFLAHDALTWALSVRFRFKQQYVSYPERRFIEGWKGPEFWLDYRKGLPWAGSDIDYDYLGGRLEEVYLPLAAAGYLEYRLEAGAFLRSDSLFFMDFAHFLGNQTALGNPERYLNTFLMLPYYTYSTSDWFAKAIVQHHFQGFLFDKIPGINKLGWKGVLGAAFLYTPEQKDYLELRAGIENIGWGVFRFFRVDGVFSRRHEGSWNTAFIVGISLPVTE